MPADRTPRTCPICWERFDPHSDRHTYCTTRCRRTAFERRRATPPAPAPAAGHADAPQPAASRACPHCGAEITIVALLTTPEAARPTIPGDSVIPLRRA